MTKPTKPSANERRLAKLLRIVRYMDEAQAAAFLARRGVLARTSASSRAGAALTRAVRGPR